GAPAKPRRRPLGLIAAALAAAVLVGGGVWLGTSLSGRDDGGSAAQGSEGPQAGGGALEGSVEPPGDTPDAPSTSSVPGAEKGWSVHKETGIGVVISVPDEFTDVYHDPSDDGVQYTDPKSDVTLSLKRWAAADGGSTALAWARGVGDSYADNGYSDIHKTVTRTSFHGKEAAQLDITYTNADGSAVMREMRLYVVDSRGRYDLGVTMPKGVRTYEKQGTDVFKGARDRLELGKDSAAGN
ncbi:hypothetical protein G3I40_41610, partial [Streptomyces sp. SID14478]|nr:hypothetical protein [Streptomyces sp. SID14478]